MKRLIPSSSKITDKEEAEHYWETLLRLWQLPRHIRHFPGANPVSLERADFERLDAEDFLVALKTDGVRYLLVLTCKPRTAEPIALMIDRTKAMYEVEVWANEDYFYKGSIYDGELVRENDRLIFVVFDVVVARGIDCHQMPYRERLQVLHNTILCVSTSHSDDSVERMIAEENRFLARGDDSLCIVPKKCVDKAHLMTLWSEREASSHGNDGIIFTLNAAPVEIGTCASILKWKPQHSVDVQINLAGDGTWQVSSNENSSSCTTVLTAVDGLLLVLSPNPLLDAMQSRLPAIVECAIVVHADHIELTPERERTDKTSPNTTKTIAATVRNVQENVTMEQLRTLVHEMES